MDRPTIGFWLLVSALLGASAFYAAQVWQYRAVQRPTTAELATGDVVTAARVLDGDTLVVAREDGARATVRLLGIHAFDAKTAKDATAAHGRAAVDALQRAVDGQPLRVLLNTPPRDRHGRVLASLFVGGDDIGLSLVARGHALAYTVYPFPLMQAYMRAQGQARQQRLGLWADPAVTEHADALIRAWARTAP